MNKDQLFVLLAKFLKTNVQLVADSRDSNDPWTLLGALQRYEEEQKRRKA